MNSFALFFIQARYWPSKNSPFQQHSKDPDEKTQENLLSYRDCQVSHSFVMFYVFSFVDDGCWGIWDRVTSFNTLRQEKWKCQRKTHPKTLFITNMAKSWVEKKNVSGEILNKTPKNKNLGRNLTTNNVHSCNNKPESGKDEWLNRRKKQSQI